MPEITEELAGKFEILAKASMDGYWCLDASGRIIFASQLTSVMYGYSTAELIGMNLRDFEAAENEEALKAHMANIMASGYDRFETRHYRKDGSSVEVEVSTTFLPEEGIFLAFTRDITERKRADNALISEKSFLRSLIDSASDAIYFKDPRGVYIGCNKASERLIGLPEKEQIGKSDVDFFDRDFAEAIRINDNMILGGGVVVRAEEWLTSAEGKRVCLDSVKAPIFTPDGRLLGLVGISRDITEQKRIEEQLDHSQKLLSGILENAPFACCVKDVNNGFRTVLWNKVAEQIFGISAKDVLGKNAADFLHVLPEGQTEAALSEDLAVVASKTMIDIPEEMAAHPDKGSIYVHTRKIPLIDSNGNVSHIVVVCDDITEQRYLLTELVKKQKMESLGVLAGGIAHDFNNILTGIIGNISFARNYIEDSHKSATMLLKAEKAANRAAELANQLLTFAKGGEPIKKAVAVRHVLEESASFVLRGSNVSYDIRIPEDLAAIHADEGQIGQVISNIIINAAQAMPGGGRITISGEEVTVAGANTWLVTPGSYVKLALTDSGCGITEEDQKRVFDPYFTTKSGGSGLGLALSQSIVARHGGYIGLQSVVAKGTTFEVLLPVSDDKVTLPKSGTAPVAACGTNRLSLLVMDDEEVITDIASCVLGDLGYTVQTCSSGEEAIRLYKTAWDTESCYSAVVMDLTVPGGMGGSEAAQHILAINPQARLIVSSGYSNDPVMAEHARFGFCAVLKKPFNSEELLRVIETALLSEQ
ncbi:MAG: PAS domain S-box protein [Geobacteraceae bacterium]|nr:PAS domain S-box protein [Geobacteraceae bacterium]